MNKANPLPALTSRFPLILLSNLFTAFEAEFEAILITNPGNRSLEKGISRSVTTFLLNLFNQKPRNPADCIVLHISAILSFISVDILLAKAFLILVVCFVVRNNT